MEHTHKGDEFENDTSYGDVRVLLEAPVHPVDADAVQEYGGRHDVVKGLLSGQFRDGGNQGKENDVGDHTGGR